MTPLEKIEKLNNEIEKLNKDVCTISSEFNATFEKKQDQNLDIERLITQIDKIVDVSLDIDKLYSEYIKVKKENAENEEDKIIKKIGSIEERFKLLITTFFSAMHTLTKNYGNCSYPSIKFTHHSHLNSN